MWTTTGPATNAILRAAGLGVAHHRRDPRDAGLDAALGRHVVGHEREVGARRGRGTPASRGCLEPADDPVAGADLAQLPADGAPVVDDDDGVHALPLDGDPPRRRPAPGCAGWSWNRSRPARSRRGRPRGRARPARRRRGSRTESAPRAARRAPARSAAETFSVSREKSSLVRPSSKCRTSKAPPRSMTVSKIALSSCESTRCPSAATTAEWDDGSVMMSGLAASSYRSTAARDVRAPGIIAAARGRRSLVDKLYLLYSINN